MELYFRVNMKASGTVSNMRCPQKNVFQSRHWTCSHFLVPDQMLAGISPLDISTRGVQSCVFSITMCCYAEISRYWEELKHIW